MKFTCELPDDQRTIIEFSRSSFWGSLSIKADGQVVLRRSAFNPLTHFYPSLTRKYEFSLPGTSPRHVCVTKERPLLLAGFRQNRYVVSSNGQKIGEYVGS
jgi:hypothetical protein